MFKNCKIIGDGIEHHIYAMQPKSERPGDKNFVMSRGELMTFSKCPAKWILGVEDEDTKSTEWGDLIDSLLLSPAKFEVKFAVAPAEYEPGKPWNWNATKCKAWREEKEDKGLTITTDKAMKQATTALRAIQKNHDIMELIECSKTQVMATGDYLDAETGLTIPLKVLLDLVPDKGHARWGKSLADFKTAQNAAMFEFGRAIYQHHYDAQGWLYRLIYNAATNEGRVDWEIAVQESSEPFHSEIYTLSESFGGNIDRELGNGGTKVIKALKLYCWCLKNNIWPGYSLNARDKFNGIAIIQSEDWMTTRLADFCPIPLTVNSTEPIGDDYKL